MTVICIAGMHRSGTSMVARLLNLCGVHLGDEKDLLVASDDNPEGFWENGLIVAINDDLLLALGGGWDYPPKVEDGWENISDLEPLRVRAAKVIMKFEENDLWAWKDPRNSILLPFWKQIIPDMKVLVCVRDPYEVYSSLRKRNYFSAASAFNLWLEYYKRLLISAESESMIVTHFDSFFHDPRSELVRLLRFFEMEVSEQKIENAIKSISIDLRHNRADVVELLQSNPPIELLNLYDNLCNRSGFVFQTLPRREVSDDARVAPEYLEYLLRKKISDLKINLAEKEEVFARANEMVNSAEWKLAQALRRIRNFLFPVDSIQEKIVRFIYNKIK